MTRYVWIKCKYFKVCFSQTELSFLGHDIFVTGIKPLKSNVETIRNYPQPKVVSEILQYIGLINYLGRFIPDAATVFIPMVVLDKGAIKNENATIKWPENLK